MRAMIFPHKFKEIFSMLLDVYFRETGDPLAIEAIEIINAGTLPNPGQTEMPHFLKIGFEQGAKWVSGDNDIDIDQMYSDWSETLPETADLLGLDGSGMRLSHGFIFRHMAAIFLDYMMQVGASNYVAQEIEITPSLAAESGIEAIVITVETREARMRRKRMTDLDGLRAYVRNHALHVPENLDEMDVIEIGSWLHVDGAREGEMLA